MTPSGVLIEDFFAEGARGIHWREGIADWESSAPHEGSNRVGSQKCNGGAQVTYDEWLRSFLEDKEQVPGSEQSTYAVHTVQRYMDRNRRLWEMAFTYTDRVVTRSGAIQPDGVTVEWTDWTTQHEIKLPKKS